MYTKGQQREWLNYLLLVPAACAMALNYQIFILHNAFAPAGINGLATMVQYLFHFSLSYMSLIINIPLAVFAFFRVNRPFALKSLLFTVTFSLFLLLLQNNVISVERFIYHTNDGRSTLLAPVASATINGLIYSVAIRCGASTGGTDFVGAYIHKRRPEFSMMRVIFIINAVVAGLSYFVYDFNIEPVILCIVYSYIVSGVSERIQKGGQKAVKAEIISAYPEKISETLTHELRHGVTLMKAEGGWSHQEKTLLICVMNPHQVPRFTELMREFPDTFICMSDVTQTLGNFKHIGR